GLSKKVCRLLRFSCFPTLSFSAMTSIVYMRPWRGNFQTTRRMSCCLPCPTSAWRSLRRKKRPSVLKSLTMLSYQQRVQRENDVKLAKEIQKMGKKFYFVRSKVDNDLQNAQRSQRDFDANQTLSLIRENCKQGLLKEGVQAPQVFLLSNFELQRHDFHRLHETLERELPDHKKNVLLFAMPNVSLEIIEKKKEAFSSKIPHYAFVSAACAAVPVPGLSVAVDGSLIAGVVQQYKTGFGLDIPSLQRLANSTDFPTAEKSVKLGPHLSATITLSTGSPQGCVLSPLLYALYTYDCSPSHPTTRIIKYADDTTVVGLITDGEESAYREEVETISTFKFLGTHISSDNSWTGNIRSLVKKAQQRLHFLRILRKTNLDQKLLLAFYHSAVESVLTHCLSVWYAGSKAEDRKASQMLSLGKIMVKPAKEIQKMGERFYFVRFKVDNDLQNAQRSQRL
ncbi:unnamed protein product, partial [Tetraodon nigroviridis]